MDKEDQVILDIIDILKNDTQVLENIGTFIYENVSYPKINNGAILPRSWDIKDSTICVYSIGTKDGGLNYGNYLFNVACRADDERASRNLAKSVFNALNRRNNNDLNIVASLFKTLTPINPELDGCLTPVQLRVKTTNY